MMKASRFGNNMMYKIAAGILRNELCTFNLLLSFFPILVSHSLFVLVVLDFGLDLV